MPKTRERIQVKMILDTSVKYEYRDLEAQQWKIFDEADTMFYYAGFKVLMSH